MIPEHFYRKNEINENKKDCICPREGKVRDIEGKKNHICPREDKERDIDSKKNCICPPNAIITFIA